MRLKIFLLLKFVKENASFGYFDKPLIVLFATSGTISIASFATVIGTSTGMASASFSFAF